MTWDDVYTGDWGSAMREFNRRLKLLQAQGPYTITGRTKPAKGRAIFSQHKIGTAADIRTRDLSELQVRQLLQRARELGLVAVDETKQTKGTAPHVHVQAFPAGVVPPQVYRQLGVQIQQTP